MENLGIINFLEELMIHQKLFILLVTLLFISNGINSNHHFIEKVTIQHFIKITTIHIHIIIKIIIITFKNVYWLYMSSKNNRNPSLYKYCETITIF